MGTILVTGGAGFIGSHLCDALLGSGHIVVAVDDLSLGCLDNVRHLANDSHFRLEEMDILDYSRFSALVGAVKPETVFHLAANSDIASSQADPGLDLRRTFQTTFNALSAMREAECRNIVFSSSSAIYGETQGAIDENYAPLFPVSHYGAAKLAGEAFISSFANNYDFRAWIVRFPNVVGERATHGVIFDFIRRLKANPDELRVLGNGRQNKPYLYVADLVEALLFIWRQAGDGLNYFNVGVESRTKVSEIASMVIEEMGLKERTRVLFGESDRGWAGDVPEFDYCLKKVQALGWKAERTSNEAVRLAVRRILGKEPG
jgi:UDP-glucose 4-epimerase